MRYFHITNCKAGIPRRFWKIQEIRGEDEQDSKYWKDGYVQRIKDVGNSDLMKMHGIKPVLCEGESEGEYCGKILPDKTRCPGLLESKEIDGGCFCHTGLAPCGFCTAGRLYCEECGWEEENA